MANTHYTRARDAVKTEIDQLTNERDAINEKIAKLHPIYEYLSALSDQPDDSILKIAEQGTQAELGLSNSIRHVLKKAAPSAMAPTAIRDGLAEMGFDLSKYANMMPPIHNTLKRLEETGEIKAAQSSYGKV